MLETIITALLPIVVTLMLGYFAGWERSFSQDQATVLNRMVMLYALPLMLFAGILSTSLSAITQNIPLFVWTAVGMVGGLILVFVLSRFVFRSSAQLAALRAIAIAGPAVPFVGTPVLGVLYPNGADIAIATGSLLMNLVQVPLALIFLVGGQQDASAPRKSALAIAGGSLLNAIRQPVVWAPVLAFILLLSGLELPRSLKGSFTLLGQSTGGVALFAVGIVLFSQKVSVSLPVIVNVISKNLLLPGIILALMLVFGVAATERGLVSVTLAIPTASIAVIFAVEYKCGTQEMASTLFWSTLLSILTMGMFIWFTA
ncbi:AEC family transporter [Bordetella trematum]|uniref:AEC family transporter n=1 Tax=Bordetella trematum TaxID=123899 RepID=UPI000D8CA9CD|nr:AEC family transporter [Bordetella trematum]SPU49262.1 transporter [Bordetella trematum]VDH03850.1 putative transporter YfdV [Bordetella trematum]